MISKVATKTTSCGKIKVKKTHSQKTFPGVPDQAGLKGLKRGNWVLAVHFVHLF